MCTAASYKTDNFYFGRTLDYEMSYGEEIVIMPRNFPLKFRHIGKLSEHYAIIGTAHVAGGCPLFYDGANEKGLAMAGLNFVGNAYYFDNAAEKDNIPQFEFIPWILSKCADLNEAKALLGRINITNEPFSPQLPTAQLHWIIGDKNETITVESVADGLKIYDNPAGVLTNNPPFPFHQMNLSQYQHLSPAQSCNRFAKTELPSPFAQGMGAIGLPGDYSSASRYVKAAFLKLNSVCEQEEEQQVVQFFHILDAVAMVKGSVITEDKQLDLTLYSCCISAGTKTYYYRTSENSTVHAIRM
ncbi:MAG: choloylglycine hydrolase, partial [Oscillospiraceae bacterium]|nr:choloylglycine hydrolase [Oscillospiraceae bacterium]